MRLAVFLHGTTIMHRAAVGRSREERVAQVRAGETSVRAYAAYVPIGDAPTTLRRWQEQGAEIVYLSSHRNARDAAMDEAVLRRFDFPAGPVLYRRGAESYGDVAEAAAPDVLIEDDCESIGGAAQMTYPHLRPEARQRIAWIVVPEFGGIDHLPAAISDLASSARHS